MQYDEIELVPWKSKPDLDKKPRTLSSTRGRRTNAERGIITPPRLSKDENRAHNRALFAAAVVALVADENSGIESVEEVGESAFVAKMKTPRHRLNFDEGKRLAAHLPGQIWPGEDNKGMMWQNGGGGPHGWLLARMKDARNAEAAQAVMLATIPADERPDKPLPFTIGGVAGWFLRWVQPVREHCWKDTEARLEHPSGKLQHMRAKPGRYSDMVAWDVSSYYYSLICKLPSPLVQVYDKDLLFPLLLPPYDERWRHTLAAIGTNKALRNSLWGRMLGSEKQTVKYRRNKQTGAVEQFVGYAAKGPLRPAALLVARSGHELTQLQSLGAGSVRSHTDAVIIPRSEEPALWRSFGLTVIKQHEGETHIVDLNAYKVGPYKSLPYQRNETFSRAFTEDEAGELQEQTDGETVEGTDFPDTQYHRLWL